VNRAGATDLAGGAGMLRPRADAADLTIKLPEPVVIPAMDRRRRRKTA
jgi:hypothetical protein